MIVLKIAEASSYVDYGEINCNINEASYQWDSEIELKILGELFLHEVEFLLSTGHCSKLLHSTLQMMH